MKSLYLLSAYLIFFGLPHTQAQKETRKRVLSTIKFQGEVKKVPLSTTKVNSSMHCVHVCVTEEECGASVFQPPGLDQNTNGSCFLYDSLTEKDISRHPYNNGTSQKYAFVIKRNPRSCREVNHPSIGQGDGIYNLEGIGKHFCKMEIDGCSNRGWTLALKVDGNKRTFAYSSSYWTNTKTYNEQHCLRNISSNEEGKFQAFTSLPFEKICLEMRHKMRYKGIELSVKGESLYQIFKKGQYIKTHAGRSNWMSLIDNVRFQVNCNEEGINNQGNRHSERLGIQGNDQDDCETNNSQIGVGLYHTPWYYKCDISSGNCHKFTKTGVTNTSTVSYIYIS